MKTTRMLALFAAISALMLSKVSAVDFEYSLKEPGFVSAAVYDKDGAMVRTLLYLDKQETGKHSLSWDGRDRYGQPMPQGKYEWRLLRTPGFSREFLLDLGVNITWREHDYWPGNHFGPSCVMVDETGDLYVGAVSSEGPPHMIRLSPDGKTLRWSSGTWGFKDGLIGMARIGDILYILTANNTLYCWMADKGAFPWGHPKLHRLLQDGSTRGQFADLRHPKLVKDKSSPMCLAGGKNFLVAGYKDFNEVRLLWPVDDKFVRDETVAVPAPAAVAVAPDGRIFVISGESVVVFDEKDRKVKTLVDDKDLLTPMPGADAEHRRNECACIAYDPANDDILVASGGQVRRYHATDGKFVAAYGRPEGRKYGVFNPLEFDGILSLATDGKGGFFTAELCPRRVAHFSGRETLKLENQWLGGMGWEGQAVVDPADPSVAFLPVDYKHLGRATIDYKNRIWTLTHIYETPDTFSWGLNACDQHEGVFPSLVATGICYQVRHVDGEIFLINAQTRVIVLRIDSKENRIVPVAMASVLHPTIHRRNPPKWWIEALKEIGVNADYAEGMGTDNPKSFTEASGYKHFSFTWSDTNGNGAFDVDEVILGSIGCRYADSGYAYVDDKWNIYYPSSGKPAWMMLPNESKDGKPPIWKWDNILNGSDFPEKLTASSVRVSKDGSVYETTKYMDGATWDLPPIHWPNNAYTTNRFIKWSKDGKLQFCTGFHSAEKKGPPGGFTDLRAFVGEVRGNIVIRDAASHAMVWTQDGLYAGNISNRVPEAYSLDKTKDKPSDGPWSDDCWGGQIFEAPNDEILWCANDSNNTMVLRVKGWDGWERQNGTLSMDKAPAPACRKGDGLQAEYFNSPDLTGEPVLKRVDSVLWFGKLWGDHREIPVVYPWIKKGENAVFDPGKCSVRWTGFVEPPFSENVTFWAFVYGSDNPKRGAKLRMWIDGKPVADSWNGFEQAKVDGWVRTRAVKSVPVPLKAGQLVPIKIEYSGFGGEDSHYHLYWESPSLEQRHIPQEFLYSQPPASEKAKTDK